MVHTFLLWWCTHSYFPGLIPLIKIYIESIGIDAETESKVQGYLDLITKRASGELLTTAAWMRKFVRTHGDYKGDSIVSQRIAYDLMVACNDIGLGERPAPELLGSVSGRHTWYPLVPGDTY